MIIARNAFGFEWIKIDKCAIANFQEGNPLDQFFSLKIS
jgi:hypothetical protein